MSTRPRPQPRAFSDEMSVAEARALLISRLDVGATCPCCNQHAQAYRRQIYSEMARFLIISHRRKGYSWFHGPSLVPEMRGGDVAKLRYWGLIAPRLNEHRDDGSLRTGWWRVTLQGALWINDNVTVPKYAIVYDDELVRLEGEPWRITDALGKRFNYRELMEGI